MNRAGASVIALAVAAALAGIACGSGNLPAGSRTGGTGGHVETGGGGGGASADAGFTDAPSPPADAISADARGAADAVQEAQSDDTPPAPTGRRSFVVTTTVTSFENTGTIVTERPSVNAHQFTMVLDWDAGTAIIGSADGGGRVGLERTSGGVVIRQSVSFRSADQRTTLTYASIDLAIAAGGETISGVGQGRASCIPVTTDVGVCSADFTMSLSGVPDTQPPFLTSNDNAMQIDPFHAVTLTASEPVPADTRLVLADLFDAPVVVAPTDPSAVVFTFFPSAGKLWHFDDRYTLMADSLVDFAGNRTTAVFSFTTGPPPPLVAEDGFESSTATTVAGAQVLSGPDAPVISGTRSLYIPSLQAPSGSGWSETTQLALRVALEAGDKVLRFAYRTVNPGSAASQWEPYYLMASEGGQIVSQTLGSTTTGSTTVTIPGGGQISLGPLMTAEFALPPDAAREIVLTRNVRACCLAGLHPFITATGIIIDDVRAE